MKAPDIMERVEIPTTPADYPVRAECIGGMLHLILAETRPASLPGQPHECTVAVRLAMPTASAIRTARMILAAVNDCAGRSAPDQAELARELTDATTH